MYSKTKIDKAGKTIADGAFETEDQEIEAEIIFDDYRRSHLHPLTEATLRMQSWLSEFDRAYYIAQRLKRKPQIIRKLGRFHVRLTQLQDIGGNRIIVDRNDDVDALRRFLFDRMDNDGDFSLIRKTDYRVRGRDDTGYRALHLILGVFDKTIELQLRSRAQHYWAESIERASVIYGHHLKEGEGNPSVINYFKRLSDIFFEIESGREPSPRAKMDLDTSRELTEEIIVNSKRGNVLSSHVNDEIMHTLLEIESNRPKSINNWILIFDWNSGHFVSWESISRNPNEAYSAYVACEDRYTEKDGFEVVLVGSSNVSMIRRTHSHYFGIDGYDGILEGLDTSIIGFSTRSPIDSSCRKILHTLFRKNYWGKKTLGKDTLRNHYCKNIFDFDASIERLKFIDLIIIHDNGSISLNQRKQQEVKGYL